MAVKNPAHRDVKKTLEYMESLSFDPVYEVLARIPLTQNPVTGDLEREVAIQGNASFVLTYDGSGNLQTLAKTINGTTYTKTFTWTGSNLTGISVWV